MIAIGRNSARGPGRNDAVSWDRGRFAELVVPPKKLVTLLAKSVTRFGVVRPRARAGAYVPTVSAAVGDARRARVPKYARSRPLTLARAPSSDSSAYARRYRRFLGT